MAGLALLVWTLLMTGELHRTIKMSWTIGKMEPKHDHQVGTQVVREQDSYVVANMGRRSKIMIVVFVQVPRLIVALGLLCVGLWFLGTTYQTEDLLLNAIAFQIIKDIDELLFAALAPTDLSRRLSTVTLKSPRPQVMNSLYKSSVIWMLRLGFVALVLLICNYAMMVGMEDKVQSLSDKLCANKLEFTWTLHPISRFPVITDVSQDNIESNRMDELTCFYSAQYNMLQVYAGFDTTDDNSTSLIDSSNSICSSNQRMCGFYDLTSFRKLHFYSRVDAILDSTYCLDNVLALHMTKSNCSGTTHSALSTTLNSIDSCHDVKKLFECQGNETCASLMTPGEFENYRGIEENDLSPEWMQILLNICPKSAGLCDVFREAHNSSSRMSRRLDANTAEQVLHSQAPDGETSWPTQHAHAGLGISSSTVGPASGGGGVLSAMDADGRIHRLERESMELAQQMRKERQRTTEVVQRLEDANAGLARQVEELQKTVLALSSQIRAQAQAAQI